MVQWAVDGWVSLGVHVDFRRRVNAVNGERFGPYVDLHLGVLILSVGVNPLYSGELDSTVSVSRGGERADCR